jgi:hypothetical protein
MSKMKRAMFFKGKCLLDDKTVFYVEDVRLDNIMKYKFAGKMYFGGKDRINLIMRDLSDGSEFWHTYNDKQRKKLYVVVACLCEGTRRGNGEPE